jgi:hypothetical protein
MRKAIRPDICERAFLDIQNKMAKQRRHESNRLAGESSRLYIIYFNIICSRLDFS